MAQKVTKNQLGLLFQSKWFLKLILDQLHFVFGVEAKNLENSKNDIENSQDKSK